MTTDITELAQRLKAAAEKASNGDWVKESGEGWEACCSANDQANGGFIIAHFVGPDAAENREFVQAANPANVLALVDALEYYKSREERVISLVRDNSKSWDELYRQVEAKGKRNVELVEALEKAQQRIAELENNEIQEEGNQFLVVRHPGKVPVIKHPVGELEDYLRQIFKADPLATIDIVTHRYYGVGGQFVEDADEYLHEMSIKVEDE